MRIQEVCDTCQSQLTDTEAGQCDRCLIMALEAKYEGKVTVAPALRLSLELC